VPVATGDNVLNLSFVLWQQYGQWQLLKLGECIALERAHGSVLGDARRLR
jgi:hypothetical protein